MVCGLAAFWQFSPFKRKCLRACHRSVPLPLVRMKAEVASIRFGVRNGSACVGSCWALMLVMLTAPVMFLSMGVLTLAVATSGPSLI